MLQTTTRPTDGFKRGQYARIPDDLRVRLIKMVVEDGVGVVQASARLNIKYTTGKHIVRRYLKTGQYVDRRFKVIRRHDDSYDECRPLGGSREEFAETQKLPEISTVAKRLNVTLPTLAPEEPSRDDVD